MNIVIILAGGKSTRFGEDKLEKKLGQCSVLEKTIQVFEHHSEIDEIILVGKTDKNYSTKFTKISQHIDGGKTRYESFCNGINFLEKKYKEYGNNIKILTNNGANPFVTKQEISAVIEKIQKNKAVGVGRKITNTLRKWEPNKASQIVSRENIFAMETPQGAMQEDFIQWIKNDLTKSEITDELMLAELNNQAIEIIPASKQNIKITIPEDLSKNSHLIPVDKNSFSIGFGIDSHRFDTKNPNKKCVLCGVEIKNSKGFLANSDGDVAFHAIANAVLSAIGENSFSSIADPLCKSGITDSEIYLQKVLEKINEKNKRIQNITVSFEGKTPKLEKYFPFFRKNLSRVLNIQETQIGLNATTGEKLDSYGNGEGLKVYCNCLVGGV